MTCPNSLKVQIPQFQSPDSMKTKSIVEPLELRIAPATLVNPTTVTYTDTDGDLVTVKISKGAFDGTIGGAPSINDFVFANSGAGEQLRLILIDDEYEFAGAKLTITATPAGGGDGMVDIGFIDASDIDLRGVTVDGDLGRIEVGDSILKTPGLGLLKAHSIGVRGLDTQGGAGSLDSIIIGRLGKLDIADDVEEAAIYVDGDVFGSIGSVFIGDDLRGLGDDYSGTIQASGNIGSVKIGGDIFGAAGAFSGSIRAEGSIGPVTLGGNLVGATGESAGAITAGGNLGKVFVGGFVTAAAGSPSGDGSGVIETRNGGSIAGVTIADGLFGGAGIGSGSIRTLLGGNIGRVKIGASANISTAGISIDGGAGENSGAILVNGNGSIASVTVAGAVVGDGNGSASIRTTGSGNIGAVKIGGALQGGTGDLSGAIRAERGAIASVTINGDMDGGSGGVSGAIVAGLDIGQVKLLGTGSVLGDTGGQSGAIISFFGDIASVAIGGSLQGAFGDAGTSSASIEALRGTIGKVSIGEDMIGGSIGAGQSAANTGAILAGNIGTVFIGDDLISGLDDGDLLTNSGAIRAQHQLKSVTVGGDITGRDGVPVVISGRGQTATTATADVAIRSVIVKGSASFVDILAGYGITGTPLNPDAQIGSVKVTGDWTAGNIVAGVTGGNGFFGDTGDQSIFSFNDTAIISKIASIVIGTVTGTPALGDAFGFVAEHVVSVKIGGVAVGLIAGARNDTTPVSVGAATLDVFVAEVL
jgi:hypothetical protein